ncbi:MAG: slipin family protein [Candidatus Competibacterales bacterium]
MFFAVDVWEYEGGLLYEKGRFVRLLEPGRYRLLPWQGRRIRKVDLRQTSQTIQAQEILTQDKINIRVSLVAQYQVSDPVAALHQVASYPEQLYQDLQLTLRESIAERPLEALLKEREVLSEGLRLAVAPRAEAYGVALRRVGVKDIVLPGAVREVFLQEVEADLKGRANLAAARHEVAAARARANTAKLMDENPVILQLQELETLAALADKPGNLVIIPGLQALFNREGKGPSVPTVDGTKTS